MPVEKEKVIVALASREEILRDLRRPDSFDVVRPRQIEVTVGDRILIAANDKRLGLTNGQALTISSIAPDGALQTTERLCVPADLGGLRIILSLLPNGSPFRFERIT